MKIKGIDGLTLAELQEQVSKGGRFVRFSYCYSLLVLTIRKGTDIYFIRNDENAFLKSWPWTLATCLFGWWGLPWGIFSSIGCLTNNIQGGSTITDEVMQTIYQRSSGPVFEFENEMMAL